MTRRIAPISGSDPSRESRVRCQLRKMGAAGLATRVMGQSRITAHQSDGRSRENVLQMGSGQSIGARSLSLPRNAQRVANL
jgi:hypothetical protein